MAGVVRGMQNLAFAEAATTTELLSEYSLRQQWLNTLRIVERICIKTRV